MCKNAGKAFVAPPPYVEAVWHVPCGGFPYGEDNLIFVVRGGGLGGGFMPIHEVVLRRIDWRIEGLNVTQTQKGNSKRA